MISPLTIILGGLGRSNKRIHVTGWPAPAYQGTRLQQARWVDNFQIMSDPYTLHENPTYLASLPDFLKDLTAKTMLSPPGERSLMSWHVVSSAYVNAYDTLIRQPEDACRLADGTFPEAYSPSINAVERIPSLWPEIGIKYVNQKLDYIFGLLKSFGLELDYWVDQQEWSLTPWTQFGGALDYLPQDPRWPAVAAELGFNDLQGVKNFFGPGGRDQLEKYSAWCSYQTADILHRAVYSVILKYWPHCKITDYAHFEISPSVSPIPDINGWNMNWTYKGQSQLTGACSDLNYLGQSGLQYNYGFTAPYLMPWDGGLWNCFVLSLNQFKAIVASSNGRPCHPIFATPSQFAAWGYTAVTNAVYKEHIIHAALIGADALQFWSLVQSSDGDAIDEIMMELDSKISGIREIMPESLEINWHPTEMRTSLKVNGRVITRVTDSSFNGKWLVDGL